MADALAELILEPEKGKVKGTALMVVADYDVINQELVNARLADGTPIPMDELVRLACDADLLPGVFRAATQEMNLGRKRRTASEIQRAAVPPQHPRRQLASRPRLWHRPLENPAPTQSLPRHGG